MDIPVGALPATETPVFVSDEVVGDHGRPNVVDEGVKAEGEQYLMRVQGQSR